MSVNTGKTPSIIKILLCESNATGATPMVSCRFQEHRGTRLLNSREWLLYIWFFPVIILQISYENLYLNKIPLKTTTRNFYCILFQGPCATTADLGGRYLQVTGRLRIQPHSIILATLCDLFVPGATLLWQLQLQEPEIAQSSEGSVGIYNKQGCREERPPLKSSSATPSAAAVPNCSWPQGPCRAVRVHDFNQTLSTDGAKIKLILNFSSEQDNFRSYHSGVRREDKT